MMLSQNIISCILASVPEGAYGPRAIKWASCNGDALSCIPKLKMASSYSYKERTNHCPLECLSSLAQKSASSDITMSAVNNTVTPGPQSFGSGTVETSQPQHNQIALQQSQPFESKNNKGQSEQENPNGNEQQKPEGNNGEQTEQQGQLQLSDPNADASIQKQQVLSRNAES